MDRRAFALWATVIGLIIGIFGNVLFYGNPLGFSFPLFTVVAVGMLLISGDAAGKTLWPRNLWPLIPLLFFATMVAFRTDPLIVVWNILAVLALGNLILHYLPSETPLDEDTLVEHTSAVIEAGMGTIGSPVGEYTDAWDWIREHGWRDHPAVSAVLRGLAITLPIVTIFAGLLGSADIVFGEFVDDVLDAIIIDDFANLFARLVFIFLLAWLMTGALSYGLARRVHIAQPAARHNLEKTGGTDTADTPEIETDPPAPEIGTAYVPLIKRKPVPIQLGIIETGMILGAVDLLFAAFVLIQFAYFFGGRENIFVGDGYTFAEYARRGFAELITVSVLTLGLMLGLDRVTIRRGKRDHVTADGSRRIHGAHDGGHIALGGAAHGAI